MRRCPTCGAANAEQARWCSQCFAALGQSREAPPAASGAAPAERSQPLRGPDPGIRRGERGLEWQCVACESVNPMAASECSACGLPFAARFALAEAKPAVDWSSARTASLLLPGLGHVRAGHSASGIARIVLFVIWSFGGLMVLLGAGARGLGVATPLLLGAAGVHALSQRDLRALERGRDELLQGRVLLGLVAGVTVLMVLGALIGLGEVLG